MPATVARCSRVPASRRAAIRISAGVRTLTTTAWARPALDDHRDGQAGVAGSALTGAPRGRRALPCAAVRFLLVRLVSRSSESRRPTNLVRDQVQESGGPGP